MELRRTLITNKKSESEVQAEVRLEAESVEGLRLFRNNVGVFRNPKGQPVHCGLTRGALDLIGWQSIVITPEMVGTRIAKFTAVECKRGEGGRLSPEQKAFIDTVNSFGGKAICVTDASELLTLLDYRCAEKS